MKMKDRVLHTGEKRTSKKLKKTAILTASFSLLLIAGSLVYFSLLESENTRLSKSIDNYVEQIDILEETNDNESKYRNP